MQITGPLECVKDTLLGGVGTHCTKQPDGNGYIECECQCQQVSQLLANFATLLISALDYATDLTLITM